MAFTYNLNTPNGVIRLLINDKYEADPIFQDEELTVFYSSEGASVKKGAALALETIARDEALVQKVVKTLQLSTDGAKLSAELRAHAKLLRDQAAAEIEAVNEDSPIEIAEWLNGPFAYPEYIRKAALRRAE